MAKTASLAAYRTSHAAIMSTPSPRAEPCTATMTGKMQRSGAPMACWNSRRTLRTEREARAESCDGGEEAKRAREEADSTV